MPREERVGHRAIVQLLFHKEGTIDISYIFSLGFKNFKVQIKPPSYSDSLSQS